MGKHADCPLPLLEATQSINARRPQQLVDKLVQALGTLANKRIALLGLSFKAHTDDIREAPSLVISRLCIASGAEVHAYDAYVRDYPVAGVVQHDSVMAAVEGADALIVLTEAEQQLNLDWPSVAPIMRNRLVIDGRNGLDWKQMRQAASELGITYVSIGRPPIYANARMEAMR
jgi:UDPglucose 6-dehydrogenase